MQRFGIGLVAAACLVWLAFRDGGYFPITWNVGALVLLWIVVVVLLWRRDFALGRLDAAFLLALATLLVWTALSALWSIAPAASILEAQRTLLYVAALAALLAAGPRDAARPVAFAVMTAATLICAYALGDRLIEVSPLPYNRLGGPLEYWNALGMLAAAGACVAISFVAHGTRSPTRAVAGASLPILVGALYLTFSRGSWLALVVGLAVSFGLERRRREFIGAVAAVAVPCLAVVASEASATALITPGAAINGVTSDAHRVALLVLLACVVCASVAGLAPRIAAKLPRLPDRSMRVFAAASVACAVAIAVVVAGGPGRLPGAAASAFDATPPSDANGLNARLVSFSGSGRSEYWRVALTTFASRPLIGHGAGTYARLWLMKRHLTLTVQDAHSLYLETLTELGVVGLLLLLAGLAVPLVAARRVLRVRDGPSPTVIYVPALIGAYVAFLAHAGLDWDWEMPVVTIGALACGAGVVASARDAAPPLRRQVRVGGLVSALCLAAIAFVFLLGTRDLNSAAAAAADGESALSADAHAAERWAPWSPDPARWLATIQLQRGNRVAARQLLTQAIAKDGTDWSLWLAMAAAEQGAPRTRAILKARKLDPLGPEVAQTEVEYGLASEGGATPAGDAQ